MLTYRCLSFYDLKWELQITKSKNQRAVSLKFLQHAGAQFVLFGDLFSSIPEWHCGEVSVAVALPGGSPGLWWELSAVPGRSSGVGEWEVPSGGRGHPRRKSIPPKIPSGRSGNQQMGPGNTNLGCTVQYGTDSRAWLFKSKWIKIENLVPQSP